MKDFAMPIPVMCPACGAKMIARDSALGERRKCSKCGESFLVRSANGPTEKADTSPLDPGWMKVAVGYRLLGFASLFTLVGLFCTTATCVIAWAVYEQNPESHNDTARTVVGTVVGVSFGLLVMVLSCLGAAHFLAVPADEDGGRGKTLAAGMLVFGVIPCLSAGALLVLPAFSAGVGSALGNRRLTDLGWGLYAWILAGPVVHVLAALCLVGADLLGIRTLGFIVGGMVTTACWVLVFLGVWGTFTTFRQEIESAIRDRGIAGDDISDNQCPQKSR